jgi:3-hydroxyisobutyrate dehydrogenase
MTKIPDANPGSTRVGWIGTGVMGAAMCAHLLEAGYAVSVYTRARSKADASVTTPSRLATSLTSW